GPATWGGVDVSIASATAFSVLVSACTDAADGTVVPRPIATTVAVTASMTSSSATTAGHHAVARRLTAVGSDIVRWNSARRLDSDRYAPRRSRDRSPGASPGTRFGARAVPG